MPFEPISIKEKKTEKLSNDKEFKEAWEQSRNEYTLLHDLAKLRKEMNLTQKQLAAISNCTQQEISRLEKREHSPSLKTYCKILNSIGYELVLKEKGK